MDRRLRPVTDKGPLTGMTGNQHTARPPFDTFLSSKQVFARYGWGRTLGYQR